MNERQNSIFAILAKQPKVTVKELSARLGVSEVTIRKDLTALEEEGVLKRTHGGAVQISLDSIEKRITFRYEEKLKIVKKAIEIVKDGETILIEAGSTNTILARELGSCRNVHIITNSLYIPRVLKQNSNVKVTVIGGEFQPEAEAMVGPMAKLALENIFVNKAFVGMDGFSESMGFTCGDFMRAEIGREMGRRAETVIILAESSKFDNTGITSVAELSRVNIVITDKEISEKNVEVLKRHNITTIIAE